MSEALPLDEIDRALLLALSADGRRTAAALAKPLGLSRQAVAQRLRDLEGRGVIRGYHADVDPGALGLTIRAHLRLNLAGTAGPAGEKEVLRRLRESPLVRAIHRVSGEDCFAVQVICRRIEDVTALLAQLQATRLVQSSRTAFVLEPLLDKAGLGPLEPALAAPPGAPPADRRRGSGR